MDDTTRGLSTIIGLAAVGPVVVGALALVAALFSFDRDDFVGAGVCLIASAISFGLLSGAVLGSS